MNMLFAINSFSAGTVIYTSESDVGRRQILTYKDDGRRQILTYKDGSRTEIIKIFVIYVDR